MVIRNVRQVTGYIARQLRDLRTIGAISAIVYNKALQNVEYARKVIKGNKGKAPVPPPSRMKVKKGRIKDLEKKVKDISALLENDRATHTHRYRAVARVLSSVNSVTQTAFSTGSITSLETAMANLRFFDPGTNALVTADPSTGTYQRDILCNVNTKMTLRNNYQTPADVRLYFCRPKADTSISPTSAFTNGLTDQGNPSSSSPVMYLTDSQQFKELWSIEASKKVILEPGEMCSLSYYIKDFEYDFASSDAHSLAHQRRYNGYSWVIRIVGVLGHDTTLDEQGFLQCGVDAVQDVTYVFKYDAGKDLNDYSISDNSSTFTNGGVVSSKPVSDNIGYSVA